MAEGMCVVMRSHDLWLEMKVQSGLLIAGFPGKVFKHSIGETVAAVTTLIYTWP